MIYLPNGDVHLLPNEKPTKSDGYPSGKVHDFKRFFEGEVLRFGVVSDTHLGSSMERLEELNECYEVFHREKITTVFHAGDVVAGSGKIYHGQQFEMKVIGMEAQAQYVAEQYPRIKGITTYYILGNHDCSFLKEVGANIGHVISNYRDDLVLLDEVQGTVEIARGVRVMLWHPGGGAAYALSYKGQRMISSLEGGSKPQILLSGHYHCDFYMDYRNVYFLQVGCFERQSMWLKALGLMPSCSAWLVTCRVVGGSIVRFQPELLKWY